MAHAEAERFRAFAAANTIKVPADFKWSREDAVFLFLPPDKINHISVTSHNATDLSTFSTRATQDLFSRIQLICRKSSNRSRG